MTMATTYSYAQLEQLWINAGGSKATAPIAAAIAEAESGGNPAALNLTDNNGTQTSVGLWQVSNGTHTYPTAWTTPDGNAAEAVAKYQAGGWAPWGTYDSGAYEQYLSPGTTPDPNVPTATLTAANTPGTSDCMIGPVFGACILRKSQARALVGGLCVAGGGLIMGMGLALIAVFALNRAGMSQTIVNMTPYGKALNAPKPAPAPAPRYTAAQVNAMLQQQAPAGQAPGQVRNRKGGYTQAQVNQILGTP